MLNTRIARYEAIVAVIIISILGNFALTHIESQAGDISPAVGDSWIYAITGDKGGQLGVVEYDVIGESAQGLYAILSQRVDQSGVYNTLFYIDSSWGVSYETFNDTKGDAVVIRYRNPPPFIYHPKSSSEVISFSSNIDVYVNNNYAGSGSFSSTFNVSRLAPYSFRNTSIQVYVVSYISKIQIQIGGSTISIVDQSLYVINNSFKLPFEVILKEYVNTQAQPMEKRTLQEYRLNPDPISFYSRTNTSQPQNQSARTTQTNTSAITATTSTPTQSYTSSTPATTASTTQPQNQGYNLSIVILREGNYSNASISLPIEIRDLRTPLDLRINISTSYSALLPSSTYAVILIAPQGRTEDGLGEYSFSSMAIESKKETQQVKGYIATINLDVDTTVTITIAIIAYNSQRQGTDTQQTTTSAEQAPNTQSKAQTPQPPITLYNPPAQQPGSDQERGSATFLPNQMLLWLVGATIGEVLGLYRFSF
jgi:hypothetical protein